MDEDNINPNHYKQGNIEVIDFILDQDMDYLTASVMKYICRWRYKNGLEDLKKAQKELEKKESQYANIKQEQELYDMQEMLTESIRGQEIINKRTREFNATRENTGLKRSDKKKIKKLASVQSRIVPLHDLFRSR